MAVRVKVRIESGYSPKVIESVALLNSGFESEEPLLLVPRAAAVDLGLLPQLPAGASQKDFETPAGIVRMYTLPLAAKVAVVCDDRETPSVSCNVTISDVENELILSDSLIDSLNISLESPGRGLWRFRDESPTRPSLPPRLW